MWTRAKLAHAYYRNKMFPQSREQAEQALSREPPPQLACYVLLDSICGPATVIRHCSGCSAALMKLIRNADCAGSVGNDATAVGGPYGSGSVVSVGCAIVFSR